MGDPRQRPDVQAQLIAFGRWLRTVRQFRDLTQEQLGERAGIERAIISRIERGELNPGIAYLWPLADALRVKVRDLFPDDDHPLLPPRD
jgi:transcriptional regulator with XRE-family HTH domain